MTAGALVLAKSVLGGLHHELLDCSGAGDCIAGVRQDSGARRHTPPDRTAPDAISAEHSLLDEEYARPLAEALVLEREASVAANSAVSRAEIGARLQSIKSARAARMPH